MKRAIATLAVSAITGAGGYAAHSSTPASCWVKGDGHGFYQVHSHTAKGWMLQDCIFERVNAKGVATAQLGKEPLGSPVGIPAATQPVRASKLKPIFHYTAARSSR